MVDITPVANPLLGIGALIMSGYGASLFYRASSARKRPPGIGIGSDGRVAGLVADVLEFDNVTLALGHLVVLQGAPTSYLVMPGPNVLVYNMANLAQLGDVVSFDLSEREGVQVATNFVNETMRERILKDKALAQGPRPGL